MADAKRQTAKSVNADSGERSWLPRPSLAEPPRSSVVAAMLAFPEIVANGSYALGGMGPWGYALPNSEKGRYGTLRILANYLRDEGHTPTAAAWAVYHLAGLGFIVDTGEKLKDGERWCVTTPALLDWWRNGCPLESSKGTLTHEGKRLARRTRATQGNNGRPPIEGKDEQQRLQLWDDWQTAKAAGIEAKAFCGDQGLSVPELYKIGDWIATRRRRGRP